MNLTKKYLLTASAVLLSTLAPLSAQTALFSYNDGNGTPNVGSYTPGSSFTFAINLAFTPGGTVTNLEGLTYYLQQQSPAGAPFNFAITLRDVTGSQFTDLQTPGLSYPQALNPANASDLGALLPGNTGVGANTYFIANITISIDPTAAYGTYFLSNTTTPGKKSVITSDTGATFAIPPALYEVDVVPEPGTWAVATLLLLSLAFFQRRRFTRTSPLPR
jgi:hypothetical protein